MTERHRQEPLSGIENKPLHGSVFVCIGASRPKGSIGGPTAVALAEAGSDVYIVGGDPSKTAKANTVLEAAIVAGGTESGQGTFDVTTKQGRKSLVEEVKQRYGTVDGVLYYPAGGLIGKDDAQRLAAGKALNVEAPYELALDFLFRGLIKRGGIFQMSPSIYSWGYPDVVSPDPRYNIVAQTKHEGEVKVHKLVPAFEHAGVSLVYLVGNAIQDTFSVRWMLNHIGEDERAAVMATVNEIDGAQGLPEISDMVQSTVRIATQAKEGTLPNVYVEYIGIPQELQRPIQREG